MEVIPSASEKESFLYIILSTRLYIYFVVSVDAGKSFSRLILSFLDSDSHWARRNLVFCVLCVGVKILCKHVQVYVCVCVCSGIFVDMAIRMDNTRFKVATNHRKI